MGYAEDFINLMLNNTMCKFNHLLMLFRQKADESMLFVD